MPCYHWSKQRTPCRIIYVVWQIIQLVRQIYPKSTQHQIMQQPWHKHTTYTFLVLIDQTLKQRQQQWYQLHHPQRRRHHPRPTNPLHFLVRHKTLTIVQRYHPRRQRTNKRQGTQHHHTHIHWRQIIHTTHTPIPNRLLWPQITHLRQPKTYHTCQHTPPPSCSILKRPTHATTYQRTEKKISKQPIIPIHLHTHIHVYIPW